MHRARVHETELALLQVDVDDFRRVNEKWGHQAGDALLRVVADRLRSVVRPQDLLARQGGDEFALLLKDLPAGEGERVASELAARLLAAVRDAPHVVGDLRLEIRVSLGIGLYRQGTTTTSADLLQRRRRRGRVGQGARQGHASASTADLRRRGPGARRRLRPRRGRRRAGPRSWPTGAIRASTSRSWSWPPARRSATRRSRAGPEGSPLHRPDRLFAAAAAAGRIVELDWACRARRRARRAGGGPRPHVIVVPQLRAGRDRRAVPGRARARCGSARSAELDLVLEITERAVTAPPGRAARAVVDGARERRAWRSRSTTSAPTCRSLALLPLVEPDVIKLDLRLVQDRPSTDQAAIVSAVAAERERTGAQILAEGIESDEHVAIARALGATLGQGWRFGRPGPLRGAAAGAARVRRATATRAGAAGGTPFEVVAAARATGEATKRLLLPMSHHLEQRALRIGEGAVILSAFQDARHFTPATVRRYEALARRASLVARVRRRAGGRAGPRRARRAPRSGRPAGRRVVGRSCSARTSRARSSAATSVTRSRRRRAALRVRDGLRPRPGDRGGADAAVADRAAGAGGGAGGVGAGGTRRSAGAPVRGVGWWYAAGSVGAERERERGGRLRGASGRPLTLGAGASRTPGGA